ncbi:2-hydroxyacid dehydrogenase [Profundibacterium mesophilum]|uniref:Gyoxylatehydroxypyruvate reductase A n=1 Tax=Profundibacterium mesophilum KAUST100406-0324 TaxID=1037889 RepID=A0A921NRT9_9RHOB|nr:glyoxylate/hydroxypyruvate reductase A [Profundibacterium mesophilum]KAF0676655.1 gyoxylatehydroxypyruvate reductase A [Profundibacterium mesophilum KAUST100406-0324]
MIRVLFAAPQAEWEAYRGPLACAFEAEQLDVALACDHDPAEVDYMIYAPDGPVRDFTPYTRCRAVLGLWAGVEGITGNPTLKIPLARMVDEGLTQGMVEWVCGHVLRHHLGLDAHIKGQDGTWRKGAPPLAWDRRVSILGLGVLGAACARALAGLGFDVAGWSRGPKDLGVIGTRHGEDGLEDVLRRAEILVLLLPLTEATRDLLDARRLAMLPRGAVLVNPGRGPLIDDAALLAALDEGRIGHATLDVFRTEPLPEGDPYWAHPRVTVTPHIASETRPASAARVIARNIRRAQGGQELHHLVDRESGY